MLGHSRSPAILTQRRQPGALAHRDWDYLTGVTAVLPELVVSDFAGTTMKEEGAVLVAYRLALTEFDIPFTEEDLAARRGASKRAVFQELAERVRAPEEANQIAGKALTIFEDS